MKVYIVTSGIYSDYHICAVFDNKESAELYCAVHERDLDEPSVEEYDTEEVKLEANSPVYETWEIEVDRNGNIVSTEKRFSMNKLNTVLKDTFHCDSGRYRVSITSERNITGEQAQKIARDRMYQVVCEELENERASLEAALRKYE